MPKLTTATVRLALRDRKLRPRLVACMCDMESETTAEIESGLMARFPEGKDVDVPAYLREHGNPEAADRWETEHKKHQDLLKQARTKTATKGFPLEALVEREAKSLGLPNWQKAKMTPQVKTTADKFSREVSKALAIWTQKYPPEDGATAADLMDPSGGNAPYNVFMTLEKGGGGIWDGRWSIYYRQTRRLEQFLSTAVFSEYEDLKEALIDAAYATGA